MTHTNKLRLIAAGIIGFISVLEVLLICHVVNAGFDTPVTLTSIIGAVIIFNTSVWWFRHRYDSARIYYAEKESKEEVDT